MVDEITLLLLDSYAPTPEDYPLEDEGRGNK